MPKLSVIVLIYNTEKYIERCARSLFEQTLDDIEYVFVNDCTPDDSINKLQSIIDAYPSRRNQVKILHHEVNRGQAQARKTGMLAATGDYVIHCDSDDWVDSEMYEKLYTYAEKNNFDMVWCDYYNTDGTNNKIIYQTCIPERRELVGKLLTGKLMASLCNRLYKSYLHSLPDFVYPTANMTEDFVISLQIILSSERIGYLPSPLYYYYKNPNSICNTLNETRIVSNFQEIIQNTEIAISLLRKNKLYDVLYEQIACKMLYCKDVLKPLLSKEKYRKLWKMTYQQINEQIWVNPYVRNNTKIRVFFIKYNFYWMYLLLDKIKKVIRR